LVAAIGAGEMTYAQIAEALGLSEAYVAEVARGQRRADLQEKIAAFSRGYLDQAYRLGAKWARGLLTKHIKEGIEGTGETARRCREYVLSRFLTGAPGLASQPPEGPQPPDLTDLSPSLKAQVLAELLGPQE